MSEPEEEGWPCYFSEGVAEPLAGAQISPTLFSAVVALSVEINETRGDVSGRTASVQWPQRRGVPLGKDGILGVTEYVVVADAAEPHRIITRVRLYQTAMRRKPRRTSCQTLQGHHRGLHALWETGIVAFDLTGAVAPAASAFALVAVGVGRDVFLDMGMVPT
ncbi:hypothetical protein [Streptosporangium sp. G12]